ncbi:hypothetical protein B0H21DRAFT_206529 [Amylocystis lapponica]|nr:hypothetical protein B0H21DRAFT_206529 [Amylocystis lapponica]
MARKRRSLQSLFTPTLSPTASPSPPSRTRSHSTAAPTATSYFGYDSSVSSLPDLPLFGLPITTSGDSPPLDLLDDDPFANLSPAPSVQRSRPPSLDLRNIHAERAQPPPRSPLSQGMSNDASLARQLDASGSGGPSYCAPAASPPTPTIPVVKPALTRPKSSGPGQTRPAYTRPAFTQRPSLPSLNTLAQSHVIVPKVRRGRVGAQLPLEPWDDVVVSSRSPPRSPTSRRHLKRPTELSTIRDSRMILGGRSLSEWEGPSADNETEFFVGSHDTSSAELSFSRASPPPTLSSIHDSMIASSSSTSSLESSSTDSFLSRSTSPTSTIPSLCPSSPGSFSDTAEHCLPFDTYSHAPYPRDSHIFTNDLAATLGYSYTDALSELAGPPSPETNLVLDASMYYSKAQEDCESGTSPDTIRNIDALSRKLTEHDSTKWDESETEPELPLSPGSTSSTFSTSVSGRSRSSSRSSISYDYGEETSQFSRASKQSFGVPWPSYAGATPHVSVCEDDAFLDFDDDDFIFDDDATERSSSSSRSSDESRRSIGSVVTDELVDAGEGGSHRTDAGRYAGGGSGYGGSYNGRPTTSGSGSGSGGGGLNGSGGGRRGRDDDDRRDRRPPGRPAAFPATDSETSESEEESSDDHEDAPRTSPPRARRTTAAPTEDDVPLAQQIPTALKAQRTIRRQVRDEIDQRRAERTLRPGQTTSDRREALARSARAAEPAAVRTMSGTTPRVQPVPSTSPGKPVNRPRTKTLPGNVGSPISVGDLTKKLLGLQSSGGGASVLPSAASRRRPSVDMQVPKPPSAREPSVDRGTGRSASLARQPSRAARDVPPPMDDGRSRVLRPSRSVHHLNPFDASRVTPGPASAGPSLSRSGTVARKVPSREPLVPLPPLPAALHSRASEEPHDSLDRTHSVKPSSRRPSMDRRTSGEQESISAARARQRRPSAPAAEAQSKAQAMWQQRIFIVNMQRFCLVEIGSATSAADVLQTVDGQGALDDGPGSGGWMLWEVSQDFGMERPVRSFELLSDVCGAWNTDKIVNLLVIRKTPLASLLSRSNIPSSSPICSGYVQHEYKRGKWQKRWMELREHSIWLKKRESGKDQVFLCSLNNFDAYYVSRAHKAPKSYVFAVKSTDSLTFFENTSDYVHVFACDEGEGKNWLEKVLLARSYVLYQERNVLSSTPGAGLTRAGTRKAPGLRPVQPLMTVGPPKLDPLAVSSAPVEFEPGSLLAKRKPA